MNFIGSTRHSSERWNPEPHYLKGEFLKVLANVDEQENNFNLHLDDLTLYPSQMKLRKQRHLDA